MPRLFVLSGKDVGRMVEVSDGATLGRGEDCTVRLRHASVSREHARIERDGDGWLVVDLGSRNGVRVDGDKVERAPLEDGAVFACGELELRFRVEEDAAEVAEPPRAARAPAAPATPVPAPVASDPGELDLDEIVLEEPDEPVPPPPRPAPRTETPAARSAPPSSAAPASSTAPARRSERRAGGSTVHRARPAADEPVRSTSRGVLQYQRVEDREGFLASDLAQQPAWVKLVVALLVAGLFAALGWAAFRGTTFLREKRAGDTLEDVEPLDDGDGR